MANEIRMQSFNATIKVSGQNIVIKRFDKNQIKGYLRKNRGGSGSLDCPLMYPAILKYPYILKYPKKGNGAPEKIETVGAPEMILCVQNKYYDLQEPHGAPELHELADMMIRHKAMKEQAKRERFEKTNRRAKETIFDLVACNVNKESKKDINGKYQKIKFMTLTFRDDISDLKIANGFFTDFMKRLSYYHFGEKKNLIKYIAVPELQERGVWHFHVVLFNCPFTSNKPDKITGLRPLEEIWGHGYVFINALKQKSGKDIEPQFVAGYVTKYMTKELEFIEDSREVRLKKDGEKKKIYTYDRYNELNLWGMKRYSASKGLKKPVKTVLNMDKEDFKRLLTIIKAQKHSKCKEFKQLFENKITTQDGHVLEWSTWVNSFTLKQNCLEGLLRYIKSLSNTSYRLKPLPSITAQRKRLISSWDYIEEQAKKFQEFLEWQDTMVSMKEWGCAV